MQRFLRSLPLCYALALYGLLCFATVRGVGVVGEVAASWVAVPTPAGVSAPLVAVDVASDGAATWSGPPLHPHAGHSLGPLACAQTRPLERWTWGLSLPLAVNTYTGGLADWPARMVFAASSSVTAVRCLHVLLGAVLLVFVYLFLKPISTVAAWAAPLVLATDWCFIYYRKVLGGTELVLLLASLLVVWGVWRRRRGLGGGWLLPVAVGLGLQAKITFIAVLLAVGLAAWLTRRDAGGRGLRPGGRVNWRWLVVPLLCAPLLVTWLHRGLGLPDAPLVWSHDTLSMQFQRLVGGWERLFTGAPPAREGAINLFYYLFEPLGWFATAYDGPEVFHAGALLRGVGWLVTAWGVLSAWRRDRNTPAETLLRFISLVVPLQLTTAWLLNRDLHHLATAQVLYAVLVGLAAGQLAAQLAPRWRLPQALLAIAVLLPCMLAGSASLLRTDALFRVLPAPTFTEAGQRALVALLREQGVRTLWTSDYDLYGVFELRAPELQVRHAWGAASRSHDRAALAGSILRAAAGGHWLLVRPTAPMIYNLTPEPAELVRVGAEIGLSVEEVAHLDDAGGAWAWLVKVQAE